MESYVINIPRVEFILDVKCDIQNKARRKGWELTETTTLCKKHTGG